MLYVVTTSRVDGDSFDIEFTHHLDIARRAMLNEFFSLAPEKISRADIRLNGYDIGDDIPEDVAQLKRCFYDYIDDFAEMPAADYCESVADALPGYEVSYYDYKHLRNLVYNTNAQTAIDALGRWFDSFGGDFWNGEKYDADLFCIRPVYEEIAEDEYKLIGYEKRN